ncbi:MAG: 4Fe-4S binding protein [Oscillospiraceae bacterium]|nr:4Fe-4S binding protein [Oscillospiraceae bacterium]
MGFHVNESQFDAWLTEQKKHYDIYAPKCFAGSNTFSDVDCIRYGKVRLHDFGIMGMTEPLLDPNRCVSCGACVKKCEKKSVGALAMQNYHPIRDAQKCIGCGECVINCPNRAWTRSEQKYYRLTLLGRTGKKNPRMGEDFIKWADEESIIRIIPNTYDYVKEYIDPNAPGGKEHIGYIVDRTGFEEFKRWALKDVVLPEKAEVVTPVYWKGIKY